MEFHRACKKWSVLILFPVTTSCCSTRVKTKAKPEPNVLCPSLPVTASSRCGGHHSSHPHLPPPPHQIVSLDGEAGLFRTKKHAKSFHYYDYRIVLDYEVCLSKRGERTYRSAKDIISEVAENAITGKNCQPENGKGQHDAPDTIAENAVQWGKFIIPEFSSDLEGRWDEEVFFVEKEMKRECRKGVKVSKMVEALVGELEALVRRRLGRFVKEFEAQEAPC